MRPLIGIPQSLDDRGRWREGRDYLYSDAAYARAVSQAGGAALHLPVQDAPERLLDGIDGLLLSGGDGFAPPDPARYDDSVRFDIAPALQVSFDRQLLRGALDRELPILAVCYGMQLLSLELGGSLHHHLPADLPSAGPHALAEASGRHGIAIEAGTRLASVLGASPEPVNSLHHQALADAGPDLRVSARADDGVIEGVELPGARFCMAVQWHPEKLVGPHRERLFEAFVGACARRHTG